MTTTAAARQLLTQPRLRFHLGASLRPDSQKLHGKFPLGEDAYFLSKHSHAMGVADGVGEWAVRGVDCGLYSRTLMETAKSWFDTHPEENDPKKAMKAAEALVTAKTLSGSSTFTVMVLQDNKLIASQMGDSGFLVLRKPINPLVVDVSPQGCNAQQQRCLACEHANSHDGWRVVYKTQEQQVRFNLPLQIGMGSSTTAEHAINVSIALHPGDVIVVGTDGLFDNLYVNDIIQVVARTFDTYRAPLSPTNGVIRGCEVPDYQIAQHLADALMEAAVSCAMNIQRRGPFAAACARAGYIFEGGKQDDITVTTAWVTCRDPSS